MKEIATVATALTLLSSAAYAEVEMSSGNYMLQNCNNVINQEVRSGFKQGECLDIIEGIVFLLDW
jgi:hypothetical protein